MSHRPGASDDSAALRRALVAATASLVLIALALTVHALAAPQAVWLPLALAAAAVRPAAVVHHRLRTHGRLMSPWRAPGRAPARAAATRRRRDG